MIDEQLVERLAQAVHENYLREQQADGVAMGSAPAMRAWAELDESLRQTNRAQVRAIQEKVAAIGGDVVPGGTGSFAFTEAEIEELARVEHDRFSAERAADGWTYGPVRDDRTKKHPWLVSWEDLPEAERDKDRDAVRNIPAVLATVGLTVARA